MIPDLVIKATALLGAGWIAALVLRRSAASTRHAIWTAVMGAALLLPAIVYFVPAIELPVLPATSVAAPHTQPAAAIVTAPPAVATPPPFTAPAFVVRDDAPRVAQKSDSSRMPRTSNASAAPSSLASTLGSLTPIEIGLAIWMLGAVVLVLRVAAAHVKAHRLLRLCDAPSDRLSGAIRAVAASLGLPTPDLRVGPAGMMPAVIGARRASVILPEDADSWSEERLHLVLLHECAHVRRRDALLQVLSSVATAAYWWHPLAWIAARHQVRERELACDDIVIASGMPCDKYAAHLLDIARSLKSSRQPSLAALAMARPSELEGRLIALLETRRRDARPARALAVSVVLGLVGLTAIAPLKLVARAVANETYLEARSVAEPGGTVAQNQAPPQPQTPVVAPETASKTQIDTALYDALVKALKDVDAEVRAMAVSALSSNTAEYAKLSALLAPLLADASADVRTAVVGSLLRSDATQSAPALLKALEDSDPDVRQMALAGLIRLERKDVIPYLAAALEDASEDVRSMAVLGVANLDHPQKRDLLVQAASDLSEDVRALVAFTLADENGQDVSAILSKLLLDTSAEVRAAAVMATASKGRATDVAALSASLRDLDADVRAAAAIGLGSIGDKSAARVLAQALKDKEADVRAAAAIALGSIGDDGSLQALTAALSDLDADVRKAAITAAASLGGDWQAQTSLTSTIAGTIAGTISGTLQGTLWGGYRGGNEHQPQAGAGMSSDSENESVYVTGLVRKSGEYRWREDLTAAALINEAGGLAEGGSLRGLTVRRRINGRTQSIDVRADTILRKGDYLVVRRAQ